MKYSAKISVGKAFTIKATITLFIMLLFLSACSSGGSSAGSIDKLSLSAEHAIPSDIKEDKSALLDFDLSDSDNQTMLEGIGSSGYEFNRISENLVGLPPSWIVYNHILTHKYGDS